MRAQQTSERKRASWAVVIRAPLRLYFDVDTFCNFSKIYLAFIYTSSFLYFREKRQRIRNRKEKLSKLSVVGYNQFERKRRSG